MKRVNQIFRHPAYQAALKAIEEAEENRIFCRHDMEHFLSVARLACLYSLQEEAGLERELIYAAALLHDIGRAAEYEDGTPHQEAGARIAQQILSQCGFGDEEERQILSAIRFHRQPAAGERQERETGAKAGKGSCLREYLYRADKKSRLCFCCKAQGECRWSMEKRNLEITY